ncbi:MAG: hypothetical protein GY853_01670 [PVC group bacterium]|nr:hypothetical protein [PVC group bacterium]
MKKISKLFKRFIFSSFLKFFRNCCVLCVVASFLEGAFLGASNLNFIFGVGLAGFMVTTTLYGEYFAAHIEEYSCDR